MKSSLLLLLLAAALPAAPGDLKIEALPGKNPWSSLDIKADPDRFQFAIVTDRTGGHREGVFEEGIRKLNLLQPDFVMSVGDFIEGYTTDPKDINAQWDEFTGYIKALQMPFFYVPGNHDVQNPVELKIYRERFGRDYYHFTYRGVLFLCLNSDEPFPVKISDAQVAYALKALKDNAGVRWTCVFFHRPIWLEDKDRVPKGRPTGWEPIEAALQGRPYTVFTGHRHTYSKYVRRDQRYFILATTGAGSELRGPAWGEFDHVAWVTMTEKGPLVANVLLDGVWDENVATPISSRLMEQLNKGVPAQEGGLRVESESFNRARARLRCTNDGDLPLKVRLEFAEGSALRPEKLFQSAVVPPKSVSFFDLELKGAGELKSAEVGPLSYDWTVSYDAANSPGRPPLKIQGTSRIYVDKPLDLKARKKPVVLDGKLDEWAGLPQQALISRPPQLDRRKWKGPEDCSFKFAVEHDNENIYVAVDVTDDAWHQASLDNAWAQDGIWISLDTQPALNRNKPEKERKGAYWLMLLPGKTAAESRDVGRDYAPPGVKGVAVKTKTGYTAEAVIPVSGLKERLGLQNQEIAVNLTAYDFDPEDLDASQEGTYFRWRPEGDESSSLFYLK